LPPEKEQKMTDQAGPLRKLRLADPPTDVIVADAWRDTIDAFRREGVGFAPYWPDDTSTRYWVLRCELAGGWYAHLTTPGGLDGEPAPAQQRGEWGWLLGLYHNEHCDHGLIHQETGPSPTDYFAAKMGGVLRVMSGYEPPLLGEVGGAVWRVTIKLRDSDTHAFAVRAMNEGDALTAAGAYFCPEATADEVDFTRVECRFAWPYPNNPERSA
jgi:hypothetical protein